MAGGREDIMAGASSGGTNTLPGELLVLRPLPLKGGAGIQCPPICLSRHKDSGV